MDGRAREAELFKHFGARRVSESWTLDIELQELIYWMEE